MMVSFVLSFFPRDEILNLIGSVSEDFPSYSFIEIKYNAPNRFIIFITNGCYFTILTADCTDLSLNVLGKSIKSILLLMKGILIKCLT